MPHTEDIISTESARTLDGLFRERVRRTPETTAYISFNKDTASWDELSWSAMADQVARWRAALASEDLQAGDRVAILMRNGPEWVMADEAALNLGLVVVPLYTEDRPDNIAYILADAAVKLLIVHDSVWKRVREPCLEVGSLQRVVRVPSSTAQTDDERIIDLPAWLPDAAAGLGERGAQPQDLATIVYTSGTTGRPKGVMLSHHNILSIAHAALTMYDIYTDDRLLSFLPLSHTFERTVGYYLPMMSGSTVGYSRSVMQLADDLQQLKPTALIAVPRIFERFHTRIEQSVEKKSALARRLFRATVTVGWNRFEAQQGRGNALAGALACMLWPLLDRLVAHKVRERLGGHLRLAVSGGAALPRAVARNLIGLGVTIAQGYGLTETSPVISGNPIDDNDPSSVGVPLRGVEIKTGDDDELLVKSPGIMLGYWNNHAATAQMIDPDGWLHTGDQARINGRHIYLTGRIKDILVLSNGEKVPPADMEATIGADPLIEQAMIVGEGRAYLAALLVLNPDEWVALANHQVIDPYKPESLADPRIHSTVVARLAKLLYEFPGYAKVRKVHLSLEPWTIENGLLTPTLKVKRNKVAERYADAIAAVYS